MKDILLMRKSCGVGDWIMMASLIKHINIQLPSVKVYVNFMNCPDLARRFYDYSDIRFLSTEQTEGFDHVQRHVGYPLPLSNCTGHLIYEMVQQIRVGAGVLLEYDQTILAGLSGTLAVNEIEWSHPELVRHKYIAMPSRGKRKTDKTSGKHFGSDNFLKLADMLQSYGTQVVHVGLKGTEDIPGAIDCRGVSFMSLVSILRNAAMTFTQVDGLMHLCGHLNAPHMAVYLGDERLMCTYYSSQSPVVGAVESMAWILHNRVKTGEDAHV